MLSHILLTCNYATFYSLQSHHRYPLHSIPSLHFNQPGCNLVKREHLGRTLVKIEYPWSWKTAHPGGLVVVDGMGGQHCSVTSLWRCCLELLGPRLSIPLFNYCAYVCRFCGLYSLFHVLWPEVVHSLRLAPQCHPQVPFLAYSWSNCKNLQRVAHLSYNISLDKTCMAMHE